MIKTIVSLLLILLVTPTVNAKVISKNSNGFVIHIEKEVPVNHQIAYQQFINVAQWWHPDHTWFGAAENLTITPEVGQCFCEIDGEKQALHMTISYVQPNHEIRMIGGLGPLQMLGVHGGMSWQFESLSKYKSKIIFNYQVSGYMAGDNGLGQLAAIVNQVQTTQLERLQAILMAENN